MQNNYVSDLLKDHVEGDSGGTFQDLGVAINSIFRGLQLPVLSWNITLLFYQPAGILLRLVKNL